MGQLVREPKMEREPMLSLLAMDCLDWVPEKRPTASQVLARLEIKRFEELAPGKKDKTSTSKDS